MRHLRKTTCDGHAGDGGPAVREEWRCRRGIRRGLSASLVVAVLLASMSVVAVASAAPSSAASLPDAELVARRERETSRTLAEIPDFHAAQPLPRGMSVEGADSLPSSYSSVDAGLVTSVKSQSPFGTCWAHGTISAVETSLLRHGADLASLDLSERHLAYFTYHVPADPLHNTDGDSVTIPDDGSGTAWEDIPSYLESGGNAELTSHVLAGGIGPADESVAPGSALVAAWQACDVSGGDWRQFLRDTAIPDEDAFKSSARLSGMREVPMSDMEGVKGVVRDWGSACVSMMYAYDYLNWDEASYYYDGSDGLLPNHMITIVGWDDSFPVSNFGNGGSPDARPAHPGAWLCKNSWGSDWSGGGLFWVSYEDAVVSTSDATAFDAEPESPDMASSRHVWQHDGGHDMATVNVREGGSVANVFRVPDDAEPQVLDRAGAFISSTGVSWSLQVRKNPTSASNPSTGEPLLTEPATGTTTYEGWYEFPVSEPVELQPGETFVVELTLTTANGQGTWVQMDGASMDYPGWFSSEGSCEPGESFVKAPFFQWTDLAKIGESSGCARVKAFSHDAPAETPVSLGEAEISAIPDQTYAGRAICPEVIVTLDGRTLVENTDYVLSWSDNEDAGTATVTATGCNGYTGDVSTTFVIDPAPISQASVQVSPVTWPGSSEGLAPDVEATFNGHVLVPGVDYSVSFAGEGPGEGAGEATVTGAGNFCDTVTVRFDILQQPKRSLAQASIDAIPDQVYTGGIQHPDVVVRYEGASLSEGEDYSLSWENDVNAGTATVTATGIGGYEHSKTAEFAILPASLEDTEITVGRGTWDQGHLSVVPTVTVKFGTGRTLTPGVDYEASFSATGVGGTAGTATFTGLGNFAGSREVSFEVVDRMNLVNAVFCSIENQQYTGWEICPEPTIFFDEKTLVRDIDYTLSWQNNVNASKVGWAQVTATGIGRYTGSKSMAFLIDPAPISMADVSVGAGRWVGSELVDPEVTVEFNGKALVRGDDYDVTFRGDGVGLGEATIVGEGNFTGDRAVGFEILPPAKSIAGATLSAIPGQTYAGTEIRPDVTVTCDGEVLTPGTDYSLSWRDNVNAGTATVTVTGMRLYEGKTETTFTILPAPISQASVTAESVVWPESGEALSTEVSATFNGVVLVEGIDYDVSFSGEGPGVGAGTATLTGMGNFTGTTSVTFDILMPPVDLGKASIDAVPDQTYTGFGIQPDIRVTLYGTELEEWVDYLLSWEDNVNAGTATVRATGIGDASGQVSASFSIRPAQMSQASVSASAATWPEDGTSLSTEVTATFNGSVLAEGIDYDVSFSGEGPGTGAGTATLTGMGNFTGTTTVAFDIVEAPKIPTLDEATIVPIPAQRYTGSALRPTVCVTLDGEELTLGTHYLLTWEDNVDAGIATVTATGMGEYEGSVTAQFTILPASLAAARLSVRSVVWSGKAVNPVPTVSLTGFSLVRNRDYTLSWSGNDSPGTGTVVVSGKGNFTGSARASFRIWTFADVNASTDHYEDVEWLAAAGISKGWERLDGTSLFKPLDYVARADMAAFLFRMAVRWGMVDEGWSASASQMAAFSDVSSSTPHAREIWWLASRGISTGWKVGTRYQFRPFDFVARQDMAAFLFRLAKGAGRGEASDSWQPSASAMSRFRDVSATADDNHHREVWWLAQTGVSTGWGPYSGKYEFRGLNIVARCDMAAFLHRMDGLSADSD